MSVLLYTEFFRKETIVFIGGLLGKKIAGKMQEDCMWNKLGKQAIHIFNLSLHSFLVLSVFAVVSQISLFATEPSANEHVVRVGFFGYRGYHEQEHGKIGGILTGSLRKSGHKWIAVKSHSPEEMQALQDKYASLDLSKKNGFQEWLNKHLWVISSAVFVILLMVILALVFTLRNARAKILNQRVMSKLPVRFFVLSRDGRILYSQQDDTNSSNPDARYLRDTGIPDYDWLESAIDSVFYIGESQTVTHKHENRYWTASFTLLDKSLYGCEAVLLSLLDATPLHEAKERAEKWHQQMLFDLARWTEAAELADVYNFHLNLKTREIQGSKSLTNVWRIKDGIACVSDDWVYPEDIPVWKAACAEILSGEKQQCDFQYRVCLNGKMRYFRITMLRDLDMADCVYGFAQEVTELMLLQEKHEAANALWRVLIQHIPSLMFIKNADDNFKYILCNAKFSNHVGREPEDIYGKTAEELYTDYPEEAVKIREVDRKVMDGGEAVFCYEQIHDAEGKLRSFKACKVPAVDENGKRILICISYDDTEDYTSRLELQNILIQRDRTGEIANMVLYRLNVKNFNIIGPKHLSDYWPFDENGIAARIEDVIVPEDRDKCRETLDSVLFGNVPEASVEYRVQKDDGIHYYRTFVQKSPVFADEVSGLIQDMTKLVVEHKKKEAISRMWNAVADAIPAILFVKDADDGYKYLFANANLAKMLNCSVNDIIGHIEKDVLFEKDDVSAIRESDVEVMASGKMQEVFEILHDADGMPHRFRSVKIPSVNEDGHRILIQMSSDVTEVAELSMVREFVTYAFGQLFNSDDLETGVKAILQRTCEFVGYTRAFVCCVDEENDQVRLFTRYEPQNKQLLFNDKVFTFNAVSQTKWYQHILTSRHGEYISFDYLKPEEYELSKEYLPLFYEISRKYDIRHASMTFMEVEGSPWGYVCFVKQFSPMKELTKNEKDLLDMIANIIELAITRRRSYKELKSAMEKAKAGERAKSAFVANISHEIRTPLNAVIGFSELLKEKELSEENRNEYLTGISVAGNALLSLVNDVLDFSKLSASKMVFTLTETSLPDLIAEAGMIFSHKCREKGINFVETVPRDYPLVCIDRVRVRQILFNLLGNAVKFTNEGTIAVKASFIKENDETCHVSIQVKDSGIGISPEDLKELGKPFVQAKKGTAKVTGGTGLGLAICKQMLTAMNGDLLIESVPGEGSAFTVELNQVKYRELDSRVIDKREEGKIEGVDVSSLSVLLVDDVPLNLKVLSAVLKNMNITPVTAISGEEALHKIAEKHFDVILTDLWMPEMNGVQLVREIRKNPAYSQIKIGVITADVTSADSVDYSLFDAVLTKPITPDSILRFFSKKVKRAPRSCY